MPMPSWNINILCTESDTYKSPPRMRDCDKTANGDDTAGSAIIAVRQNSETPKEDGMSCLLSSISIGPEKNSEVMLIRYAIFLHDMCRYSRYFHVLHDDSTFI